MDENREEASWVGGKKGVSKRLVLNIIILLSQWDIQVTFKWRWWVASCVYS